MNQRRINQRNRCIQAHLAVVRPIARAYARKTGQDLDDLTQIGRLGLIRASQQYERSRGIPFEVFARPHIRGAILHYLRDSAGLIRLPRRLEEQAQRILRQGGQPSDPDEQRILALYRAKAQWKSLEEVDCPRGCNALDRLQDRDRAKLVRSALQQLPRQERDAISAVILEGLSLRRAARQQQVSAMTIQRRVKRGLGHLAQSLKPHQPSL